MPPKPLLLVLFAISLLSLPATAQEAMDYAHCFQESQMTIGGQSTSVYLQSRHSNRAIWARCKVYSSRDIDDYTVKVVKVGPMGKEHLAQGEAINGTVVYAWYEGETPPRDTEVDALPFIRTIELRNSGGGAAVYLADTNNILDIWVRYRIGRDAVNYREETVRIPAADKVFAYQRTLGSRESLSIQQAWYAE